MEYLIMKLYEKEKKDKRLRVGFKRFSKIQRIIIITLSIIMISTEGCALIMSFCYPECSDYLYLLVISLITMIVLLIIDNCDRKMNIDDYVDEQKKKLKILNRILKDNYNIDSREKIDALICMYQKYIDKQNESEELKNKVIVGIFTVLGGILSASFLNLEIIGIDFMGWFKIALVLTFCVCSGSAFAYFSKYLNIMKSKYERMINDLESIKIEKY